MKHNKSARQKLTREMNYKWTLENTKYKMQVKTITQWEYKQYGKRKTSKHDGEWKNETYEGEEQDGNGNNKQWKANLKP